MKIDNEAQRIQSVNTRNFFALLNKRLLEYFMT